MALRPTALHVRRRNPWSRNERLDGSDETLSLLDNPRGDATDFSPSSSLSSERSVHSESEGHEVSWYERFLGRGKRGNKEHDLQREWIKMLIGKPKCVHVKCRNCKEYEKVTKSVHNVEDYMCDK